MMSEQHHKIIHVTLITSVLTIRTAAEQLSVLRPSQVVTVFIDDHMNDLRLMRSAPLWPVGYRTDH